MAKVTPVLWEHKLNKDGHAPIRLRFSDARRDLYASLGVAVHPRHWNDRQRRVRKSHDDADEINALDRRAAGGGREGAAEPVRLGQGRDGGGAEGRHRAEAVAVLRPCASSVRRDVPGRTRAGRARWRGSGASVWSWASSEPTAAPKGGALTFGPSRRPCSRLRGLARRYQEEQGVHGPRQRGHDQEPFSAGDPRGHRVTRIGPVLRLHAAPDRPDRAARS